MKRAFSSLMRGLVVLAMLAVAFTLWAAQEIILDFGHVNAHRLQPGFQILGQMWHSHQILVGRGRAFGKGGLHRLVEILGLVNPAPHPGQRHQMRLLILVQPSDEGVQFLLAHAAFAPPGLKTDRP